MPFIKPPFLSVTYFPSLPPGLNQMMWLVSTPVSRNWHSMLRPKPSSTIAVRTVVRRRKQYAMPSATLTSPPPCQMRQVRARSKGTSTGSKRIITSPRATPSHLHCSAGLMLSVAMARCSFLSRCQRIT